jgi:predicted transcriptional regulator
MSQTANHQTDQRTVKPNSPKHSLLDLAPLELDCMNTLWPIGEATVRQIRDLLAARRARAYTTIMTIMDRLARKGVVERRKSGRAYIYRPRLSAEEASTQALAQVLDNFFGGSKEALLEQLGKDAGAHRSVAVGSCDANGVGPDGIGLRIGGFD